MTIMRQTAPRIECPRCGVRVLEGNLARHFRTHSPAYAAALEHRRFERMLTRKRDEGGPGGT